ncbi:CRAL-TRIO domain-containing protein C34C12.6 [Trichinella pseudospiralis]|uniref:CRAL-TRIO domain-containing protein C34C12.6 n=1 Tax=Trichinella pseudospiralis TaxID=6337 RepID=A0A0V0Y4P3_TRIPS|nr:CRAL-TRIO domain-containing protein C34C12.6 [Trichinella pseudospiralis]
MTEQNSESQPVSNVVLDFEQHIGIKLPEYFRTEFYVNRWRTGWKNDWNHIKQLIKSYLTNRTAAGLDDPELIEKWTKLPCVARMLPYMRMSIRPMQINLTDNSITVIIMLGNIQFNKLPFVATSRDLTMFYFATGEYILRQVLQQESLTNAQSGVTLVYDLSGLNVMDYANPYSPIMQMFSVGAALIQEYYCDLLNGLYLLNAGTFVKVAVQIMKRVLVPRTLGKISARVVVHLFAILITTGLIGIFVGVHIISGNETSCKLLQKVSKNVVPVAFGGEWTETDPQVHRTNCCTLNKTFPDSPLRKVLSLPDRTLISIKAQNDHSIIIKTEAKQTILWQLVTSGKIEFSIVHQLGSSTNEEDVVYVIPRLKIVTPLGAAMPDHGKVELNHPGQCIFYFRNVSSTFFRVRIDFAYALCENK